MSTALHVRTRVTALIIALPAALLTACGGGGGDGMSMPAPATAMGCMMGMMDDSGMGCMAPTVTVRAPVGIVHLSVPLSATVTTMMMHETVARVDFMVDGVRVGSATMAPFSIEWDSTSVADGAHQLTASVMDNMDQTS